MTRLFRSKSCGLLGVAEFNSAPPTPIFNNEDEDDDANTDDDDDEEEENQQDEEEAEAEAEEEEEEEEEEEDEAVFLNPISTPFISSTAKNKKNDSRHCHANNNNNNNNNQFAIMDILVAALRKSIVTCSVETEDVSSSSSSSLDISWPTEVRHVSHVTFDRFNGFLGLPTELEPDLPRRIPSASVSVFGVSAQSMQCTYDDRGNSVPTILLMMQKRLYSGGGLLAEGIFRINAENSQEEHVRDQLNRGVVPHGIDVHCLAGLIKAWFRELPTGVLDSLTPEQVMHCNTEEDCTKLVKLLPATETSLLDWAINLMADVVHHEQYNKMNARNIAMIFAPNMTQMADPLTALIHAVQVMNLLKTLILKTLREREESPTKPRLLSSFSKFPTKTKDPSSSYSEKDKSNDTNSDTCEVKPPDHGNKLRTTTLDSLEPGIDEKLWCSQIKSDSSDEEEEDDTKSRSDSSKTTTDHGCGMRESECRGGGYESGDWLSLRKGVRKLCRHPVFQLNKPAKKTATLGIVNTNTREQGGEAWA